MMAGQASYAASDDSSPGRVYKEEDPPLRSQFQRDRDRVIHCSAFRRLEYKTQVFVNHEGDMFRTRLTHSIEVSQIGRTVSRALSLNEDLTEAICLAHDLGHTPFGHAGQDELNKCMKDFGGFEHNLQSLRVVDLLEERYVSFPGLNLMYETREGIIKHCSKNNAEKLGDLGKRFLVGWKPCLEAQVANIADEITYNNHDVDDGLRTGLITVEQLNSCSLFKENYEHVVKLWPNISNRKLIHELVRRMIGSLVSDLVEASNHEIKLNKPVNLEEVRRAGRGMIKLSEEMYEKHTELKQFLKKYLYNHPHVIKMTDNAKQNIAVLFKAFSEEDELLPDDVKSKIAEGKNAAKKSNREKIIADYIAGMTDRFAITECERIIKDQSI